MQVRKICLLGDFGVGKTSLVRRFVHQQFSERYLTTIGVKIDTKTVELAGVGPVKLIVWDIAGSEPLDTLFHHYLRGAAGYLLVADGTRAGTLESALGLRREVDAALGPLPRVGLLNKRDLEGEWELTAAHLEALRADSSPWLETSALSGDGVEEAFHRLAWKIAA